MNKLTIFTFSILVFMCLPGAADDRTIGRAGDALQWAIPISALLATYSLDDKPGRVEILKGIGTTFVATYALKELTNKKRPDNNDRDAFPSAHSAIAFHGATFLQERYGLKAGIPAYVAASFVAYSRVEVNRHDYQDVVAGAVLGIVIGRYFTHRYESVEITPVVQADQFGVRFAARF